MNESIKLVSYEKKEKNRKLLEHFTLDKAKRAMAYHSSFPEYSVTPLVKLERLAETLGVKSIYVKDESYRFGLNAFKVLGGSYCLGTYIADHLGADISKLSFEKIACEEVRNKLGELTFVTATDGNHGRGIAWTANRLGQKSVVFMPIGSAKERLNNIKALGAKASITSLNYDDTVRYAEQCAEEYGWILVQDTDWAGYQEIPLQIMQGYTTMAFEIVEQLKTEKPTHIFLQAGVGAMAGAITGFFADLYGADCPIITVVEPDKADCIYKTAKGNDEKLHIVTGNLDTIMAGLACGVPCSIGWNILRDYADNFISLPDYVAAKGMRVLGNPLGGDKRVISGESGAVTLGLVAEVLSKKELNWLRKRLKLDEKSKILCISTEGDTDKKSYQHIVWDGQYPSY